MSSAFSASGLAALLADHVPKPLIIVWDLLPSGTHLTGPRHDWMFVTSETMAAVRLRAQADAAGAFPADPASALLGVEIFDMNRAKLDEGRGLEIYETVRILAGRLFVGISPRDTY